MWRLLKYYAKYFQYQNILKVVFVIAGIAGFELNEYFHFYENFDSEFAIIITNSALLGVVINENKESIIKYSKLLPVSIFQKFFSRQLFTLLPFYFAGITFELYFSIFTEINDDYLDDIFVQSKLYMVFVMMIFSYYDLMNTKLRFKYLWVIIIPLIIFIINVSAMFLSFEYLFEYKTLDFILWEIMFFCLLILSNLLLYFFFKKRSDYLR